MRTATARPAGRPRAAARVAHGAPAGPWTTAAARPHVRGGGDTELDQTGLDALANVLHFRPSPLHVHYDNPPYAKVCPFSAQEKTSEDPVLIDEDLCFGGAKCRSVCP